MRLRRNAGEHAPGTFGLRLHGADHALGIELTDIARKGNLAREGKARQCNEIVVLDEDTLEACVDGSRETRGKRQRFTGDERRIETDHDARLLRGTAFRFPVRACHQLPFLTLLPSSERWAKRR